MAHLTPVKNSPVVNEISDALRSIDATKWPVIFVTNDSSLNIGAKLLVASIDKSEDIEIQPFCSVAKYMALAAYGLIELSDTLLYAKSAQARHKEPCDTFFKHLVNGRECLVSFSQPKIESKHAQI